MTRRLQLVSTIVPAVMTVTFALLRLWVFALLMAFSTLLSFWDLRRKRRASDDAA